MPRSKLEAYEDIINTLTEQALTIDDIAFECNMNCVNLQQRMEFLVKNNVVDIEISRDNKAYYVLTKRGVTIAKTLVVTRSLEKLKKSNKTTATNLMQSVPMHTLQDEEAENTL